MKIKFNVLATAAALALASVTASAAINVSSTPDLLLIAYDVNTGATYTRDLGVSLSALNSSTTFSAPAGSIFSTQFAAVAPSAIQWNVVALDNTFQHVNFYLTGDITQQQGLSSTDVIPEGGALVAQNGGLTQLDNPTLGFAKANGEYTGSPVASDQSNAFTLANNFSFGFTTSGNGVGSSQNFLKVATDGTASQLYTNSSLSAFDNNAKGGYFTLLDAQGDLKWTTADVAAVPLPAAALLFGPGLLAMFGLGRRRNKNLA
jgi:hypothetical protein